MRTGENYALVITTAGGLWRYLIGDTIRFTSLRPYKFLITGRTKHFINAFGEELMVDNAERAIRQASEATSAAVRAYTAAPLYLLTDRAKGRHRWLIECDTPPSNPSTPTTPPSATKRSPSSRPRSSPPARASSSTGSAATASSAANTKSLP